MKKLLVGIGIAVAVVVVGLFLAALLLDRLVVAGVNNIAPQITQTKVTLGSASISVLTGKGSLSDLVVGNPKGWSESNLCALGKVRVAMAPLSVLGDHIIIDEILIDAPEFTYETKLIASNVGDLLKNIEASMGGADKSAAPAEKSGKPVKFEVKKFTLTNGKVRLGAGGTGATLPMPPVSLSDLGTKEGGITPDQIAFAVMRSVTSSILSATASAAGDIGKTGGAAAAEGVKKAGEAIKGLFKRDE